MNFQRLTLLSISLVALGSPAFGQEEEPHFDIYLARPDSGTQTIFGGIEEGGAPTPGLRVFEAEFGPFDSTSFFGLEPGFNNPGSGGIQAPGALPLLTTDTFQVASVQLTLGGQTSEVFYWDGTGPAAFAPSPDVDFVIGAPVSAVAADGSYDDHPFLDLVNTDGTNTLPDVGIYLVSFQASLPGLDPTLPLFLVIGTEGLIQPEDLELDPGVLLSDLTDLEIDALLDEALEEVIEAGVAFVNAEVVPEPAGFALLVLAAAPLAARRRV